MESPSGTAAGLSHASLPLSSELFILTILYPGLCSPIRSPGTAPLGCRRFRPQTLHQALTLPRDREAGASRKDYCPLLGEWQTVLMIPVYGKPVGPLVRTPGNIRIAQTRFPYYIAEGVIMNFKESLDLKGQVAIVTGGGRGIGKFIATGLAEAGANVVIASRKLETLEKTARELEALGVKALPVKCDMGKKEDIDGVVDATMKEFGKINILVNNAGVTWGAPTLEFPLDRWDKIFEVNVRGVWIISQRVANIMKDQGGGKMINISSVMGFRGSIEEAHPAVPYNSSKAAINLLTMNLAIKLARYKINVNAIAPGFFHTDMMGYLDKPELKPVKDAMLLHIPIPRMGEEDDIKALAVFLASREIGRASCRERV